MSWTLGDLPPWLRIDIAAERQIEALAWCMDKDLREGKATEKQMLAALSLASLEAPLDSDHAQIFFYLTTKIMEERGIKIPDDVRVDVLSQYEQHILAEDMITLYRRMGKAKTALTDALIEVFGKPGKRKKPPQEEPKCLTQNSNSLMERLSRETIQTVLQL
jgi:hypothetical protein